MPCNDKNLPPDDDPHPPQPGNSRPTRARARKKKPLEVMPPPPPEAKPPEADPPESPPGQQQPQRPEQRTDRHTPARAKKKAKRKPLDPTSTPPPPDADPPGESDDRTPPARGAAAGCRIFTEEQWAQIAAYHELSGQQLGVVKHLFDDESGRGIAYLLGIEESCVRTYIRRIYKKLGVSGQVPMTAALLAPFLRIEEDDTLQPPKPKE